MLLEVKNGVVLFEESCPEHPVSSLPIARLGQTLKLHEARETHFRQVVFRTEDKAIVAAYVISILAQVSLEVEMNVWVVVAETAGTLDVASLAL